MLVRQVWTTRKPLPPGGPRCACRFPGQAASLRTQLTRSDGGGRRPGGQRVSRSSPRISGVSRIRAIERRVVIGAFAHRAWRSPPGGNSPRNSDGVLNSFSVASKPVTVSTIPGSSRISVSTESFLARTPARSFANSARASVRASRTWASSVLAASSSALIFAWISGRARYPRMNVSAYWSSFCMLHFTCPLSWHT